MCCEYLDDIEEINPIEIFNNQFILERNYANTKHIIKGYGLSKCIGAYTTYYASNLGEVSDMNGKQYLQSIISKHPRVNMDTNILSGVPSVKGTRIPISLICACLRDGMSLNEVRDDYNLPEEDVKASLNFVIDILDSPFDED